LVFGLKMTGNMVQRVNSSALSGKVAGPAGIPVVFDCVPEGADLVVECRVLDAQLEPSVNDAVVGQAAELDVDLDYGKGGGRAARVFEHHAIEISTFDLFFSCDVHEQGSEVTGFGFMPAQHPHSKVPFSVDAKHPVSAERR
jgi:hypothetical protein